MTVKDDRRAHMLRQNQRFRRQREQALEGVI